MVFPWAATWNSPTTPRSCVRWKGGVMQRLQGGTVIISTSETESDFVVTVSDDGIGFDAEQLAAGGKHIGLWNVRERLAAVCGGHMEIESGIDKGTNVTMCIPKCRKESE